MGNEHYAIGADIGGSHITSAVIDLSDGSICSAMNTDPIDSSADAESILEGWALNLRRSLEDGKRLDVSKIGFAFPGPFDYDRGISLITGVSKFESLFAMDITSSLKARLGAELELRYVNDAFAFALGECFWGAAKGRDKVLALTLGTGLGSCFVSDKTVISSGDTVPENGYVYNLPFEDGIADEKFSTRWIVKRYKELTGLNVKGAKEVLAVFEDRPEPAHLFNEYGKRLADFTYPLLAKFGCGTLLLGGNIARCLNCFDPALEDEFGSLGAKVDVIASKMLDNAALMGAASLFAK